MFQTFKQIEKFQKIMFARKENRQAHTKSGSIWIVTTITPLSTNQTQLKCPSPVLSLKQTNLQQS